MRLSLHPAIKQLRRLESVAIVFNGSKRNILRCLATAVFEVPVVPGDGLPPTTLDGAYAVRRLPLHRSRAIRRRPAT